MSAEEIERTARRAGVLTRYLDQQGREQAIGTEVLAAVLAALEIEPGEPLPTRSLPEVLVHPVGTELMLPEDPGARRLVIERDGGEHDELALRSTPRGLVVEGSSQLPVGRHRLVAGDQTCSVLTRPTRVLDQPPEREWGVFAPSYALRGRHDDGYGGLAALEELARWLSQRGGTTLATLPLVALDLRGPGQPSPYAPLSRRFWTEAIIDLTQLDGVETMPEVAALIGEPDPERRLADEVDHLARGRRVMEVMSAYAAEVMTRPGLRDRLDTWLRRVPEGLDFARYRVLSAEDHRGWWDWPDQGRAAAAALGVDDPRVAAHLVAQWVVDEQLIGLARRLDAAGQRLALDLPVGTAAHGYDTWARPRDFALGASVGAPPDLFATDGQDWGLPPLHPWRTRANGHQELASCLRRQLDTTGLLRLDHVMGLHRLWWIPQGASAGEGAYVAYPAEELWAVVAIEAHRSGAIVVGEDLGTVPPEVRETLDREGVLGMYELQFELSPTAPPPPVPRLSVASCNTHDMAPWAAYWSGDDLDELVEVGMVPADELTDRRDERRRLRDGVSAQLSEGRFAGEPAPSATARPLDPAAALRAAYATLGSSPSALVLAQFEDLWGETVAQNIPGTSPDERSNFRYRHRLSIEAAAQNPLVERQIRELSRRRAEPAIESEADPTAR